MEQEKQTYKLECTRCNTLIESHTKPGSKMTCFLCNSCHLKWKEIEDRMIGRCYEDEMRKAFINYVETKPRSYRERMP